MIPKPSHPIVSVPTPLFSSLMTNRKMTWKALLFRPVFGLVNSSNSSTSSIKVANSKFPIMSKKSLSLKPCRQRNGIYTSTVSPNPYHKTQREVGMSQNTGSGGVCVLSNIQQTCVLMLAESVLVSSAGPIIKLFLTLAPKMTWNYRKQPNRFAVDPQPI